MKVVMTHYLFGLEDIISQLGEGTFTRTLFGCHSKSSDTMPVSMPWFWYFYWAIFFFDNRCFKTNLKNKKNTLSLRHKSFVIHFTCDSNQEFLQFTLVVFLSFATVAFCFIVIHLNEVEPYFRCLLDNVNFHYKGKTNRQCLQILTQKCQMINGLQLLRFTFLEVLDFVVKGLLIFDV